MSDSERLRDDMALTSWDRTAQIAAALRIADRAKKRAEELQRAALAAVATLQRPTVRMMPCGFKAVVGPLKEVLPALGVRHRTAYMTRVSLPFVTMQHGEPG